MWPRLEEQNQETPEVRSRREELFNVIKENNKTLYQTTTMDIGQAERNQQKRPMNKTRSLCHSIHMIPWTYWVNLTKSTSELPE